MKPVVFMILVGMFAPFADAGARQPECFVKWSPHKKVFFESGQPYDSRSAIEGMERSAALGEFLSSRKKAIDAGLCTDIKYAENQPKPACTISYGFGEYYASKAIFKGYPDKTSDGKLETALQDVTLLREYGVCFPRANSEAYCEIASDGVNFRQTLKLLVLRDSETKIPSVKHMGTAMSDFSDDIDQLLFVKTQLEAAGICKPLLDEAECSHLDTSRRNKEIYRVNKVGLYPLSQIFATEAEALERLRKYQEAGVCPKKVK